jgi:xylulokinase
MSLLGIDVGTSGCKAAVFSSDGQMLGLAYEEYNYQHPYPGWAELDSAQIWQQIKRAIARVAAETRRDPIKALCVSSLGEAVVPVGSKREILGPSLLNFDTRGTEYLGFLRERLPVERLYSLNGNTLGANYSLTKLMWLKQYQPDLYRQTDLFLHWSGFVAYLLGAEAHTDYSLANRSLLFDLDRGDWSGELLDLAGLERVKFPATVPSGMVIGSLGNAIAGELGLPPSIPIVSGGHDQCCNGVGCGVVGPGRAMYGMGTYICMMPVFSSRPEPAVMIARGLNTEHHVVPGQFVSFIYNQGGVLVKWFRETFASLESQQAQAAGQDIYSLLMAEMPLGPSPILVLPHFTATGPPQFITDSCGVILGLKLETTRGEILKGILEATTFYLRECFETLPGTGISVSDFRAVGGGSKSKAWIQICADILGLPFVRPLVSEAGALGAAILAGAGCGQFSSLEEGVECMVHLGQTIEPDLSRQRLYDERFAQYRRIYPRLANDLRALS